MVTLTSLLFWVLLGVFSSLVFGRVSGDFPTGWSGRS
jgi:predicted cobalt transporter CbtA